jgi:hypothetical protein
MAKKFQTAAKAGGCSSWRKLTDSALAADRREGCELARIPAYIGTLDQQLLLLGTLGPRGRCLPTVAWPTSMPELEQFAVHAGGAPERVGEARPTYQVTAFVSRLGPSGTLDHRRRFDEYQGFEDLGPHSVKILCGRDGLNGEKLKPARVLRSPDGR